jgi:hypothetical protein
MSGHHDDSSRKTPSPKRAPRVRKRRRHPSGGELRASAVRILDILSQLVIARPEMINPLEQIVRGILGNFSDHLETKRWKLLVERRSRRRTPLPAMPLSELPALKALLATHPPVPGDQATRKTVKRTATSRKRP